jgi:hypothetical protein
MLAQGWLCHHLVLCGCRFGPQRFRFVLCVCTVFAVFVSCQLAGLKYCVYCVSVAIGHLSLLLMESIAEETVGLVCTWDAVEDCAC